MRVFRSFDEAAVIRNPVITTGSFDGVHIGHKTILSRLKKLAEKYDGESVLITFDPHPRKVLYPETAGRDLKLITSREEKLELLEKAGLDNVIIVNFTKEFSRITSEQFVRDFLLGILHAKVIVAGFNHHFGFNKEGDYRQLWSWRDKYHFEAEEIPEQEVYHETVSSTRIRQAISEGYIQRANAYLDHYYIIKGPLADFSPPQNSVLPRLSEVIVTEEMKLLPSTGIYAVTIENGSGERSKGMVIIDTPGEKKRVLVNILNEAETVPGSIVKLLFHKRIHGAVNMPDSKSHSKISQSVEEISDLIF